MMERWRALVRELGGSSASLYVVSRALSRATGGRVQLVRYLLMAQPVVPDRHVVLRPAADTVIRDCPATDALAASFPRPHEVIAARYAAGARCLAAEVKGVFGGYLWWQRDHYEEDTLRCTYVLGSPEQSVWDFDVYVEPRYRLGRLLARLWAAAEQRMAAEGACWSFSRIDAFNAASFAAHSRLGAACVGSAVFLIVGPWQLSFLPQAPFVHLSLSPSHRPTIRLNPPRSAAPC